VNVVVTDGPVERMDEYARVPISFVVRSVLQVRPIDRGLGGIELAERPVDRPWIKDYDEASDRPQRWERRFDVASWRRFTARAGGELAGGAVVAFDTPGVDMLEGRRDLAVLWDIRVMPGMRGHGVGTALFRAAAAWAHGRGARWMKIETQTLNVAACRFYARMGAELGSLHRFAYPDLPDEVALYWYLDLTA